MKGVFFLTICSLLANISFAGIFNYIGLNVGPECISLLQILRTTITLCEQRENRKMWDGVINCHRPMNDEFLRASAEAQCPRPKYVQQPNNTANSIEDVFLNICGVLEGGLINFGIAGACTIFGQKNPYVMSHKEEVRRVKETWGDNVPCDIGKCILALNIPTD